MDHRVETVRMRCIKASALFNRVAVITPRGRIETVEDYVTWWACVSTRYFEKANASISSTVR